MDLLFTVFQRVKTVLYPEREVTCCKQQLPGAVQGMFWWCWEALPCQWMFCVLYGQVVWVGQTPEVPHAVREGGYWQEQKEEFGWIPVTEKAAVQFTSPCKLGGIWWLSGSAKHWKLWELCCSPLHWCWKLRSVLLGGTSPAHSQSLVMSVIFYSAIVLGLSFQGKVLKECFSSWNLGLHLRHLININRAGPSIAPVLLLLAGILLSLIQPSHVLAGLLFPSIVITSYLP